MAAAEARGTIVIGGVEFKNVPPMKREFLYQTTL